MKPDTVSCLILKGGGVKGLAFAGALEVLSDEGFQFRTFVGTSAGSIAAVLLAGGHKANELEKALRDADFDEFRDAGRLRGIWNWIIHGGFYPGDTLKEWVVKELRKNPRFKNDTEFPELKMRHLRDKDGSRAIVFAAQSFIGTLTFDSGGEHADAHIAHAVRLSCSIPGFFIPGEQDGQRVYDGGLLHNFPIEAYQRLRGPLTGSGNGEDFIAIYLGKQPAYRGRAPWWLWEVLSILSAKDDRIILQKHYDRTVVIDTSPIGVTDFDLKEDEKKLLLIRGRIAALEFAILQLDPAAKARYRKSLEEYKLEEGTLLKSVRRVRTWRSIRRWGVRFVSIALLGLLAFSSTHVARSLFFQPQFTTDQSIRLNGVYIDSRAVPKPLSATSKKEIAELYTAYPANMTEGSMLFDSAIQIVWHKSAVTNGAQALKLTVLEGVAKGLRRTASIKIASSLANGIPKMSGYVFAFRKNEWTRLKAEFLQVDQPSSNVVIMACNLSPDFEGDRIRCVVFTKYGEVFDANSGDAVPWILFGHRYLRNRGKATYLFLSDAEARVRFPANIYIKRPGTEDFFRLTAPDSALDPDDGWTRWAEILSFIKTRSKDGFNDEGKLIGDLIKRVEDERDGENRSTHGHRFVFTFDTVQTLQLSSGNLNIVTFAEKY